jgi:hypothetical protein
MKKLIIGIGILIFFLKCSYIGSSELEEKNFEEQLGIYKIDLNKTSLGNYSSDSSLYRNLKIIFRRDSSFQMNMQVPFIFDSSGKWKPSDGRLDDWARLCYKSNMNIGTQFTKPWTHDSIFYLNSSTPKKNQEAVSRIYFKKISR